MFFVYRQSLQHECITSHKYTICTSGFSPENIFIGPLKKMIKVIFEIFHQGFLEKNPFGGWFGLRWILRSVNVTLKTACCCCVMEFVFYQESKDFVLYYNPYCPPPPPQTFQIWKKLNQIILKHWSKKFHLIL